MEKLLLEMNALCSSKKSKLVVLLLSDTGINESFFSNNNIDYVDCSRPQDVTSDLEVVAGEHPSGRVNSYWANLVTGYLKDQLNNR